LSFFLKLLNDEAKTTSLLSIHQHSDLQS